MSKRTKIWLVTATSLILLGLIMFVAAMFKYKWDFTKLSTVKYETNTYQVSKEFNNISMETGTADIVFAPSEDGICKVVCYEAENARHSVAIQDSTLTVAEFDERKWYEHIGIMIGTPKVTVYLPNSEYDKLFVKESTGDIEIPKGFKFGSIDISISTGAVKNYASASESIKIKTSTGDILVENVSANTLELAVSTGEITASEVTSEGDITVGVSTGKAHLTDIACKNLISSGSTGDITLKNVNAAEKFSIERSTGNVILEGCDAAELFMKTDTGDIKGSLLTEKIFIARSNTGNINVPKTINGGKCELETDTGDIKIEIR